MITQSSRKRLHIKVILHQISVFSSFVPGSFIPRPIYLFTGTDAYFSLCAGETRQAAARLFVRKPRVNSSGSFTVIPLLKIIIAVRGLCKLHTKISGAATLLFWTIFICLAGHLKYKVQLSGLQISTRCVA